MWEHDPSRSDDQPRGDDILPYDEFAAGDDHEHSDDARLRPPASPTLLSRVPPPVLLTTAAVFAATALAATASFAVGASHNATSQPQNAGDAALTTSASLVSSTTLSLQVRSSAEFSSQHGTSAVTHGPGKATKTGYIRPGEATTTTDEATTTLTSPTYRPSTPPKTSATCNLGVFPCTTATDWVPPSPPSSTASK